MSDSASFAYTTLVTNEDYLLGAKALARSLRAVKTDYPLRVMATRADLALDELESLGCEIKLVDQLPLSDGFRARHSRKAQHAAAPFDKGNKPTFHDPLDNFCKLRLWEFDDLASTVFIDADAIVVKDIEKVFLYPEFSAAPNLYESLVDMHRLNSGVFVAQPSKKTFETMLHELDKGEVFWRRTDQTFLETYFPDWHGLPYIYNVLQYIYFNLPVLWQWSSIHVLHYQYEKPWEANHPKKELLQPLIDLWYQVLETGTIADEIQVLSK